MSAQARWIGGDPASHSWLEGRRDYTLVDPLRSGGRRDRSGPRMKGVATTGAFAYAPGRGPNAVRLVSASQHDATVERNELAPRPPIH